MSNIVIVCNTYSQLIIAIQMKKTIKNSDCVTVIITDQSKNSETIYMNVKDMGFFEDVYYVKDKEFCMKQKSRFKALSDIMYASLLEHTLFACILKEKKYDEIIYYNPDIATHCLFTVLEKKNSDIIISRYEEGLLSYNSDKFPIYFKLKMVYVIRNMLHKKRLQIDVKNFYCFYPEFYHGAESTIKINEISTKDVFFKNLISTAFAVDSQKLHYPQKYVYFSSIYDFEGEEPVDEPKLCKSIEKIVGKDNLIVKVHPRDDKARFEREGLIVDKMSSVPWEAIQINYDFSGHIFLTIVSGSVVTINAILDNPPITYFLFKAIGPKKNAVLRSSIESFNEIDNMGIRNRIKTFRIPEDLMTISC